MKIQNTYIYSILITLLLCSSCTHRKTNPNAIEVDSLVVYSYADRGLGRVMHCFILKDGQLKIQTKNTHDTIKVITNQDDVDAFTTYMKMFYTEQTADTGEDNLPRTEEGYILDIDYYDCRSLYIDGYLGHKQVLDTATYVIHANFHDDYYRLLNLIKRLSKEYETDIFQSMISQGYPENIYHYDEDGLKTGEWVFKERHCTIVSNYKSGKLDGLVKRYSLTGELESIRHYKKGVLIKAYSLDWLCIFKNIRKSDVTELYDKTDQSVIPVHYIADKICYEGYNWAKSKSYFYDGRENLVIKARCDSLVYTKDPYNSVIEIFKTVPNSISLVGQWQKNIFQ